MKDTMIGVDLAKSVFHLYGASVSGEVKFRRKMLQSKFYRFMTEHPRGHPAVPHNAGSCMTVPAAKPERKRLDGSAQTGVDQAKIRINPAFKTRSRAQAVGQMSKPRHSVPKRVDQSGKQQQRGREGILLGECRFI